MSNRRSLFAGIYGGEMKKKRYCECGRELERYQHYCSECANINRQHSLVVGQYKYLSKPEIRKAHLKRCSDYYYKHRITREDVRRMARER